ncbi:ECF-type riboflavin transporter substrate-binding protein [uncultured Anaerococcus sp.]|uniref:ECF-type riboflavin transporter substrate-binding protein n=1 Tax=uncultured Anaerococcus sp. TaxID=293428 RepID=UPI00288B41A0|nr:ECF-type riboflavin transporter substrate-binding protein [uncultured Anaerococcus sp.]
MNTNNSITKIVATGVGAAVFFILGRFISIPIGIPNTSLETTYPFLALMAVIFGPVTGALVGLIGHAIKDLLTYGLWWSWVICSGVSGLGYGLVGRKIKLRSGSLSKKDLIVFNIGQILTNIIAWGILAPSLDILIYKEPANKVFTQGLVSAGLNSVSVLILGSILLTAYAKRTTQEGSLRKDI